MPNMGEALIIAFIADGPAEGVIWRFRPDRNLYLKLAQNR